MSQKIYEPNSYWATRGKDKAEIYSSVKKVKILEVLTQLQIDSVLEIGAGDGELTKLVLKYCKPKRYVAVDLSKDRLDQLDCDVEKVHGDFIEMDCEQKFDLVIAAHCLLHIKPEHIKKITQKMLDCATKYVVNIDPIDFTIPTKWAYYNFPHDYFELWTKPEFHQIEDKVGLWLVRK